MDSDCSKTAHLMVALRHYFLRHTGMLMVSMTIDGLLSGRNSGLSLFVCVDTFCFALLEERYYILSKVEGPSNNNLFLISPFLHYIYVTRLG